MVTVSLINGKGLLCHCSESFTNSIIQKIQRAQLKAFQKLWTYAAVGKPFAYIYFNRLKMNSS